MNIRLVYHDHQLTFEELLRKDGSFTIHQRNIQKLATEMYKIKHNLSPSFMNSIFPFSLNPYNLRNNNDFIIKGIKTTYYGSETIAFQGPKIWTQVPEEIKISNNLNIFKDKIRKWQPEGCSCRICKVYLDGIGFL